MLLPPADIVALLSHYVPLSSCHVSKVPQNRRASGPSGVPQENPAQARWSDAHTSCTTGHAGCTGFRVLPPVLVYVSFSKTLSVIRAVAVWPVVGSCTWNVML